MLIATTVAIRLIYVVNALMKLKRIFYLMTEHKLSPIQIGILLHYYCRTDEYPRMHVPLVCEIIDEFCAIGLLYPNPNDDGPRFKKTDGLDVYIDAICSVPLPIKKWVIPDDKT